MENLGSREGIFKAKMEVAAGHIPGATGNRDTLVFPCGRASILTRGVEQREPIQPDNQ